MVIQPRRETVLFRIPLEIMSRQLNNLLWSGYVGVGFPHCHAGIERAHVTPTQCLLCTSFFKCYGQRRWGGGGGGVNLQPPPPPLQNINKFATGLKLKYDISYSIVASPPQNVRVTVLMGSGILTSINVTWTAVVC